MANFEGLIRGALAAKDSSSPEVRATIYQSSRNALKRLIEQNRSLTVEAAVVEQRTLEEAISKIEAEYNRPPAPPHIETGSSEEQKSPGDPLFELKQILMDDSEEFRNAQAVEQQVASPQEAHAPPVVEETLDAMDAHSEDLQVSESQPTVQEELIAPIDATESASVEPVTSEISEPNLEVGDRNVESETYEEVENLPLEFAKRRKSQRVLIGLLVTLGVLVLLAWLAYYLFTGISNGTLFGLNDTKPELSSGTQTSQSSDNDYIVVMEPGDLSALTTSGRGEAQIVNELNLEMIRLVSIRKQETRGEAADPILIRLMPGVLEQISGKNVTFEIYAKSGSSSPAQFTVRCFFNGLGNCGRKRFRVGLQPEASIFAFDMGFVDDLQHRAYIAISTDTTDGAATTGRGDMIDIAYARLRIN